MRGEFDYRDLAQPAQRPDTELTLGATTLLLIFFGLVLLCGVCFGLGYATGHRGAQPAAALAAPGDASVTASSPHSKPAANAQSAAAQTQADVADKDIPNAGDTAPASSAVNDGSALPQVKAALGGVSPVLGATPAGSAVGPALSGALMVQIAAISAQEDADVLVSALRRRGYAVVQRREPLDGLLHVRVGPFKTRDEAETWRQKLLNDGYNAIVQD